MMIFPEPSNFGTITRGSWTYLPWRARLPWWARRASGGRRGSARWASPSGSARGGLWRWLRFGLDL